MNVDHLKEFTTPAHRTLFEIGLVDGRWIFATDGHRLIGYRTTAYVTGLEPADSSKTKLALDIINASYSYKPLNRQKFMAYLFSYEKSCEECNGTKKVECYSCDGDGVIECRECDGDGIVKIDCDECDGSGTVSKDCDECDGSGIVNRDCTCCDGDGSIKIECTDCSGTCKRKDECEECRGTGFLDDEKENACLDCEDGEIEIDCTECEDGWIEESCQNCDCGQVELDCQYCEGGKVDTDCNDCDCGQVEKDCDDCIGGSNECDECDDNCKCACSGCLDIKDCGLIFDQKIDLALLKDLSMDFFDEVSMYKGESEPTVFKGRDVMAIVMPMRIESGIRKYEV